MIMDIRDNDFKYQPNRSSFSVAYGFWVNNLFERVARLFKYDGTGSDLDGGVDPIHIEKPLLKYGFNVPTKYKGKLTIFHGTYYGQTVYDDRWTNVAINSPVYSGKRTIGKDCCIMRNNSCETSMLHLVHRYAVMLAHAEITLITLLVNARVSSVPTVRNTKEKSIVDAWRNGVYNGKINTILDAGFLSVRWQDINSRSVANIKDIMDVREQLLTSFYHDIGVRVTQSKNENLIQSEVHGNDSMLLLNINDMLENRKRGCEDVNKMFGTNWSVDKCEELKYEDAININGENATNGEIHN